MSFAFIQRDTKMHLIDRTYEDQTRCSVEVKLTHALIDVYDNQGHNDTSSPTLVVIVWKGPSSQGSTI